MPAPADPAASDSEILTERPLAARNVVFTPDKYVYSKKSLQHGGVLTCFDHMNQLLVTGVRSKTPPFSFQLKQHVIMGKLILESRCENTRSAQVGARASAKSLS